MRPIAFVAAVVITGAAATAAAEEPTAKVGYDKGFFIRDANEKGSFALKINARVQTGFEGRTVDDGDERVNTGAFLVRRARLTLEGHAHTEKLAYKLQTDFGRGFVTLKDYYVDGQVGEALWIRVGQWKRPFSRQQITSSGKLELVDRARTDKDFKAGRDIGVAVHNGYEDSPAIEYAVGVFNGTGDAAVLDGGSFSNVPSDFFPVFIARAGLNSDGLKGYSEGDFEGGALRWGAAASVWIDPGLDAGGHTEAHQAQVDAVLKLEGVSATGGFYLQTAETELASLGAFAQVGYVVGEQANVAARYATLIPQGDGAADPSHEITLGGGWFPYAHSAKVQAEVGALIAPGASLTDSLLFRVQAQLAF